MMELTTIKNSIHEIRGKRVILDYELAKMYEVETRVLKQAVRRNIERFPEDFMFELTEVEMKNLTSQIVMSSWGGTRHGSFAFTEQGIAMLSSVLKSKLVIQINISIMRAFVMMRQWSLTYQELAERLEELERSHGKRFDGIEQAHFFFAGGVGDQGGVFFCALAQVHEQGGVAAVVQDHVGAFALGACCTEFKNAVGVVPVLGEVLTLDREHRRAAGGNCGCCMVLRRIDVARGPAHIGAQRFERLDQHRGLDRHVQRPRDARAAERPARRVLLADRHQAGHLGLGDPDFLAAPGGKGKVGNSVVFRRAELGVHQSVLEIRV